MKAFLKRIPNGFWIITFVYLAIFVIMLPFRHLAYLDDFAYYQTVRNFLSTGVLKISEWAAPSLIFQTYWGALFASIFGMTYKALHFSNIFLFYFALVSFYFTLKELGRSEGVSVFLALSLFAFPNIFRTLYTFMSDPFYLSLMIISIFFTVKLLKTNNPAYSLLAALFASLAFLNRQIAISLIMAQFGTVLVKSYFARRFYLKQLVFLLVPCVLIILPYYFWLSNDSNVTNGQFLFIHENFRYLKMYILPQAFVKFRVTNDIYDEFIFRLGKYTNLILALTSFVLLYFLPGLIRIKNERKNIRSLLLGAVVLLFFYWRLYRRNTVPNWKELLVFEEPSILGSLYARWNPTWEKVFNILVFVGFIPWAYLVGTTIKKFVKTFFKKRNRISLRILVLTSLLFSIFPILVILFGYKDQGVEIFPYMFMVYLFWGFGLITICLLFFFKVRKRVSDPFSASVVLFLGSFMFLQMMLTIIGIFSWFEYVVPFIPLVLIGISFIFSKKDFSPILAAFVLLPLLCLSVSNAKGDYELNGILWETAEEKINMGLVEPTEVGIINWAWIPYFYYEESFAKRLREAGGDRRLVRQMHTWWDDSDYVYKEERLSFNLGKCEREESLTEGVLLEQIQTRSLLFRRDYCVKLIPKDAVTER